VGGEFSSEQGAQRFNPKNGTGGRGILFFAFLVSFVCRSNKQSGRPQKNTPKKKKLGATVYKIKKPSGGPAPTSGRIPE